MKKKSGTFWAVVCFIIITGVLTRFLWLGNFPPGINHDDAELLLSAKTIWAFGKDASGVGIPMSAIANKLESGTTGIPSLLLSPIIGILPLTLFWARFVFVVINLLTALFLGLFINKLTKRKKLGILSSAFFLIMPWSFAFSKHTLAAPYALLFLTIGLFLQVKNKNSSILPLSISALSYFPALVFTPLIATAFSAVNFKNKKKIFLIPAVIWIISLGYIFLSKSIPESTLNIRSGELSISNIERFSSDVNDRRRTSIATPPSNLFINKYTLLFEELMLKQVAPFSVEFLFNHGDPSAAHNFESHGVLLPLDFVVIPLGIIGVAANPVLGLFAATIAVFAPLGNTLNSLNNSFIFRAYGLVILFPILSASGLLFLKQKLKGRLKHFATGLLLLYLMFFVRFLGFYFFQLPVAQEDNYVVHERVLVSYLQREKGPTRVSVVSPKQIINQYAFYAKDYNALFENSKDIIFTSECPENLSSVVVIDSKLTCQFQPDTKAQTIQLQRDAGEIYFIYNGTLCRDENLDPWRRTHKISDYNIENLSDKEFCNRWIAK